MLQMGTSTAGWRIFCDTKVDGIAWMDSLNELGIDLRLILKTWICKLLKTIVKLVGAEQLGFVYFNT